MKFIAGGSQNIFTRFYNDKFYDAELTVHHVVACSKGYEKSIVEAIAKLLRCELVTSQQEDAFFFYYMAIFKVFCFTIIEPNNNKFNFRNENKGKEIYSTEE